MSTLEEIKARLDIVDVVSSYVSLTKSGRSLKAPCPFHNERTPSFIVSPERQSWHCFGACSTGGDVISFVMRREGIEFGEALRSLAARAGVALASGSVQTKSATVHQINDAAANFFQSNLYSSLGEAARSYLKDRGVDKQTAVDFRLGLSPATGTGAESLRAHLLAEGFSAGQMVEAGLIRASEGGPSRDFFYGRLMFPIADRRGNVAGFGARSLDGSDPKYINTAGTEVFDKRNLLYSLHLATEAIRARGEAVIVEGYMDAIAAHQHGHLNVVASMGTALTDTQLGHLRSTASSVILALDADAAGQEAIIRKLEEVLVAAADRDPAAYGRHVGTIIRRDQMEIRIALLPEGSDPDDLIRNDPQAWTSAIEGAVAGTDFMIRWLPRRFDLSSGAGKTEAAKWVAGLIYAANPFDQERYRNDLAVALGVAPERLEPILREIGRRNTEARRRTRRTGASHAPAEVQPVGQMPKDPNGIVDEYALAMLLKRPELRDLAQGFEPECFDRSEDREIFTRWLLADTIEGLRAALDPALHDRLDELSKVALEPTIVGQSESAARQILSRLEERRLRRLQDGLLSGQDPLEPSQEIERAIIEVNDRLRQIHARRG